MSLQKAEDGKITMFIKRLGKTSCELYTYKAGDSLANVIGPMFNAHKVNFKRTHNKG